VFLALGKLGYGEVFSSFVERRLAKLFQSPRVLSKSNSLMRSCSKFFDKDQHLDACISL
jgi:hypothetical protein